MTYDEMQRAICAIDAGEPRPAGNSRVRLFNSMTGEHYNLEDVWGSLHEDYLTLIVHPASDDE